MFARLRELKRNIDILRGVSNRTSPTAGSVFIEGEILSELKKLNKTMAKFEGCISSMNHQNKPCVRTGHWNDGN